MYRHIVQSLSAASLAALSIACSNGEATPATAASTSSSSGAASSSSTTVMPAPTASVTLTAEDKARVPNELGRIPVLEYHLITDSSTGLYSRTRDRFRQDLETLYARGYRPITMKQLVDKQIDLPRGLSPVVMVFDDASPEQFSYIERDGKLEIDPNSGVGIWLAFNRKHPDWTNSAVFCTLSGGAAGHSFFGEKGIKGQKSAWRFPKVKFLADNGFELCNHTLWHANLSKYSDAVVQEQIARGQLAIDSVVPGYKVRTFALPLGMWPKNRQLAWEGNWTDPKSKKTIHYKYDAILEVAGGPTRSPFDPAFDNHHITRVEMNGNQFEQALKSLDKPGPGGRFVSDGDPKVVAKP